MGVIYLVRHSQASFGAADYDQLSELGFDQSRRLGRWLAAVGQNFDLAVTGTLRRHVQTAETCLDITLSDPSRASQKPFAGIVESVGPLVEQVKSGDQVIAAASSADKLVICGARGADEHINYSTDDLKSTVIAVTAGKGADVIYDPVGGPLTGLAIRTCGWRSRHLLVGLANGSIPRVPANLALLKGCSPVGVFWGCFLKSEPAAWTRDLKTLFDWLHPHLTERFPLERAAEALSALLARKASGKLVIVPVPP